MRNPVHYSFCVAPVSSHTINILKLDQEIILSLLRLTQTRVYKMIYSKLYQVPSFLFMQVSLLLRKGYKVRKKIQTICSDILIFCHDNFGKNRVFPLKSLKIRGPDENKYFNLAVYSRCIVGLAHQLNKTVCVFRICFERSILRRVFSCEWHHFDVCSYSDGQNAQLSSKFCYTRDACILQLSGVSLEYCLHL